MKFLAIALIALTSATTFAETEFDFGDVTEAYAACSGQAKSTYDMKACAYSAYQEADRGLNLIYKDLIASIKQDPDQARQKELLERLVKAQRAWVAFRDPNCSLKSSGSLGGSLEGLEYIDCQFESTKARAIELRDLIGNI